MKYAARVNVMPKEEISDPQGQAVERTLPGLGFDTVERVRVGKRIEVVLEAKDQAAAEEIVIAMCDRMLANAVIEDYEVEFTIGGPPPDRPPKTSAGSNAPTAEGAL